ncbi:formyltransferase family protein [Phascolarctobacterium sp.]
MTNNKNTLILYDWLQINENSYCYSEPISIDLIRNLKPKMIISYNYQYLIDSECIEMMKNRIINLHISLLPWNKGSNPNFWSFIDDTPKGVSIHIISPKLDQGDIIVQEKINFDENLETLRSSYEKLNVLIQRLFKDNWTIIRDNNYVLFKQEGNGSYHNKNDYLQYLSGKKIDFDENIVSLKARISKNGAV